MYIKRITLAEVELVAYTLAHELMELDEPIPEFTTRFPNALESCLETPFGTFANKTLYKGLVGKAAILFYLMIKNHPFQNGNKRIAMTTLLVFLHRHGKWLRVDEQELYDFSRWVAASNSKLKDETVAAIETFLRYHMIELETHATP